MEQSTPKRNGVINKILISYLVKHGMEMIKYNSSSLKQENSKFKGSRLSYTVKAYLK